MPDRTSRMSGSDTTHHLHRFQRKCKRAETSRMSLVHVIVLYDATAIYSSIVFSWYAPYTPLLLVSYSIGYYRIKSIICSHQFHIYNHNNHQNKLYINDTFTLKEYSTGLLKKKKKSLESFPVLRKEQKNPFTRNSFMFQGNYWIPSVNFFHTFFF